MPVVPFAKTCFQSASQLVILANNKAETHETTIQDTREQQHDNERYDNEMRGTEEVDLSSYHLGNGI